MAPPKRVESNAQSQVAILLRRGGVTSQASTTTDIEIKFKARPCGRAVENGLLLETAQLAAKFLVLDVKWTARVRCEIWEGAKRGELRGQEELVGSKPIQSGAKLVGGCRGDAALAHLGDDGCRSSVRCERKSERSLLLSSDGDGRADQEY